MLGARVGGNGEVIVSRSGASVARPGMLVVRADGDSGGASFPSGVFGLGPVVMAVRASSDRGVIFSGWAFGLGPVMVTVRYLSTFVSQVFRLCS